MSDKIKIAAIEVFAKKGYEGTSIKDITNMLGITPPALYAHFSSKEDLFLTVLSEAYDELIRGAENIFESNINEDASSVLYKTFKSYVYFYTENNCKTIFLLRNMTFPPMELRDKTIGIFYEKTSDVTSKTQNLFDQCIERGIIKNKPSEKYIDGLYKLINSYMFKITGLNQKITEEEVDEDWNNYWSCIKV